MDEGWINVRGEIVGFLYQMDGDDLTTAVVRVDEWKHETNMSWQRPTSELPAFCLRWLGNDVYKIGRSTAAIPAAFLKPDEDEIGIGDKVEFSTSAEEQLQYAMWC